MTKLTFCLTAGIAALLPASAAGRVSFSTSRELKPAGRQFYVATCTAIQASNPRKFLVRFGYGPHHLNAMNRCVQWYVGLPRA
jgi:hypothetical protein